MAKVDPWICRDGPRHLGVPGRSRRQRPCGDRLAITEVEDTNGCGHDNRTCLPSGGKFWLKGRNSQNITYFESIYLVMATASTVDFGDVVAKTCLGWTFIIFFTLGSLILFANYVLEMVELFANKRKCTSSYKVVKGKK